MSTARNAGLAERRVREGGAQRRLAGEEGGEGEQLTECQRRDPHHKNLCPERPWRLGTAASVARIMPEEYSPVNASTPKTPTMISPMTAPVNP
jgi:hypothetical protein